MIKPTAAALILCTATAALAGPTDPPAGPIDSTYKTLDQVEPRTPINAETTPGDSDSTYKITQPGSYYLTGNITAQDNENGIEIAADNVTLDLMGFSLISPPGTFSLSAIRAPANTTNTTIKNGSVEGWPGDGITLVNASSIREIHIHNIRAANNAGSGINAGWHAIITNCIAIGNADAGIVTQSHAIVSNCLAYDNGITGISIFRHSTARDCSSYNNGKHGFEVSHPVTLTSCSATNNAAAGINSASTTGGGAFINCTAADNDQGIVAAGCIVRSCICADNTAEGINISGTGGRVESCNASGNGTGISAVGTHIITANYCPNNTTNYVGVVNVSNNPATAGPWFNFE